MLDIAGRRVALFVPCFVDQLTPHVATATLEVLAKHRVTVEVPAAQTCCGQPMLNVGCTGDAGRLADHFASVFGGFDCVVCPSASCTAMVRHHYPELLSRSNSAVCERTYELCEFLIAAGVARIEGRFAHRVGLHQGCHGLRELRLGQASERSTATRDPVRRLLASLDGLELVDLERADECCGFGGSFSFDEPEVSSLMGRDRIRDHVDAGAEVIVSADSSCLLHLDGLLRRDAVPVPVMHVAEVFAGRSLRGW